MVMRMTMTKQSAVSRTRHGAVKQRNGVRGNRQHNARIKIDQPRMASGCSGCSVIYAMRVVACRAGGIISDNMIVMFCPAAAAADLI